MERLRQLLKPRPSTESILPFLPRPVKFLLLLLFLLNAGSWPLAWHVRVFMPLIRIRMTQLRQLVTLQPKQKKLDYLRSLTPIGENPLKKETVWQAWASPDDSDWNMHLSNSSYPKTLDGARFKAILSFFPTFFQDGGNMFLGGTHFSFIREIPINSPYEIRMRIACWDQKWIYVIGQYVIPPKSGKISTTATSLQESVHQAFKSPHSQHSQSNGIPNLTGTPSSPNPPTPPTIPTTSTKQSRRADTILPDGSILACTSLSIVCCKYGRLTVPPSLVLATSGFLLSDGEWGTVHRMRGRVTRGEHEVKRLLKGGWKDVVKKFESSGGNGNGGSESQEARPVVVGQGVWWEDVMKREGVNEEVARNLERLKGVREGLEVVKEMAMIGS